MNDVNIAKTSLNINSNAGLFAINRIVNSLSTINDFKNCENKSLSNDHAFFPTLAIIKSQIGLMCLGRTSFEDIDCFKEDELMKELLQRNRVPSKETLRQRIGNIATSSQTQQCIDKVNTQLLKSVKDLGMQKTALGDMLVVDIDVSVFDNSDTKKEGVEWTYKKCFGFAPIFATIGTYGYQVANELRPGSQHSQKDAVAFLERVLDITRQISDAPILVRMDSAHDADDVLVKLFEREDVRFIIKRNPRGEDPRKVYDWIKSNDEKGVILSPFKTRYTGTIAHKKTESTGNNPLFLAYEYEVEDIGELFQYKTKSASYWTNLSSEADEIINLYHLHATSEQFHSELKTDIDIERLPSQTFSTNKFFLSLSTLAFNILRLIGQTALEVSSKRSNRKRLRLRTVLLELIYVGAIVCSHARKHILKFGRNCRQYAMLEHLDKQLT